MNKPEPKVSKVAREGIHSYADVARGLSALMADIVAGRVSPSKANKFLAEVGRVQSGKRKSN